MLNILDLTYRIEGRLLFENATANIPSGHKVGLVGRNGVGKTTLLKILNKELNAEGGHITTSRGAKIGMVSQEAPGGPESLIEWVLAQHTEMNDLFAEAETCTDPERISDIQLRLVDIDAHSAKSRAATILSGLGFDHDAQQRACADFSGGWRMRLSLGAILFLEPDILMLDEPTNYLDLEGTMWLEAYLKTYPYTVLIVSHDRDLLNKSVNHILNLENKRLQLYRGGYDEFEKRRRQHLEQQQSAKKKQDEQRKHMQAFVDRFKAKASKAKQAQSRMKMIEKLKPIAAMSENDVAPFNFPSPERTFNPPMMRFENTAVGYEEGKPILKNINLRMDPDDRIALLGANGNGKSTFAKLLAHKLEKMDGEFFHHKKVQIGYFAQHQMDELDGSETPYQVIKGLMVGSTEAQVRARVAQIGFDLDRANTKCDNLSGGEKARMLFALATFHKPNLLILDEPTNHLDVDSRQALIMALNEYEGAVILISHDRHLVEASADILWLVNNGTVEVYDGDMNDYRDLLLTSRKTEKSAKKVKIKVEDKSATLKEKRKKLAQARAKLAPLKQNITTSEANVAKLERKLKKITKALADPKLFSDFPPAKAAQISRMHGETKVLLSEWEAKWLKFLDEYEKAKTFVDENND